MRADRGGRELAGPPRRNRVRQIDGCPCRRSDIARAVYRADRIAVRGRLAQAGVGQGRAVISADDLAIAGDLVASHENVVRRRQPAKSDRSTGVAAGLHAARRCGQNRVRADMDEHRGAGRIDRLGDDEDVVDVVGEAPAYAQRGVIEAVRLRCGVDQLGEGKAAHARRDADRHAVDHRRAG